MSCSQTIWRVDVHFAVGPLRCKIAQVRLPCWESKPVCANGDEAQPGERPATAAGINLVIIDPQGSSCSSNKKYSD